jgi:hypothetical protein
LYGGAVHIDQSGETNYLVINFNYSQFILNSVSNKGYAGAVYLYSGYGNYNFEQTSFISNSAG